MTDISIIIVSWNGKEYLKECLESIPTDTSSYRIETIVVDNASTDGTPEMVAMMFPQVRLIRNAENYGFAKANNIGISNSKGRYICLINSDVIIMKNCINILADYLSCHSEIGMIGPQIVDNNGNTQRSCMGFPTVWNTFCRALAIDKLFRTKFFGGYLMTYWPHNTISEVNVINGCFWVVKREALNQVGLLDERFFIYGEDKDWCKRFWDTGWKIVYYPEAKAVHYGGASSANAPFRFFIELYRADLQYWDKYHNRFSKQIYSLIIGVHHMIRLAGELILYIVAPSKRTDTVLKIKRSIACLKWQVGFSMNSRRGHDS